MTGRLVPASLAVYPAAWNHPNIWSGGWALALGVLAACACWWAQVNSAEIADLRREVAARPDRWTYAARAVLVLAPLTACIYLTTWLTWPILAAIILGRAFNTLNRATDRRTP